MTTWTAARLLEAARLWIELGSSQAAAAQLGIPGGRMREALASVGIRVEQLLAARDGHLDLAAHVAERMQARGERVRGGPLRRLGAPAVATPEPAPLPHPTDTAAPQRAPEIASGRSSATLPADVQRLVEAAKKAPEFEVLCDRLDLSPGRARALLDRARGLGVQLHLEHSRVGLAQPEPRTDVQSVGVPPVVGEPQRVAVLSDPHFGSKYCLRAQLTDFIDHAYKSGVREVLCPGDLLDGEYRHGVFEVSHSGLDAQAGDLFDSLPQRQGLTYRAITGNHECTFSEASGLDVGAFLEQFFAARGRRDLRFYGSRGAFLRVLGATVHLWHPRTGMSYARSYAVQKQIEKYSSGEKPHVLLCGHWHQFCHVHERGVHGIACPTFQGGGSAFAKSIGGAPAIGGLILTWTLTEHATMRDLALEYRAYFEREQAREVA